MLGHINRSLITVIKGFEEKNIINIIKRAIFFTKVSQHFH